MSGENGHNNSRLDRLEEIVERQERANEAAHERFDEQYKQLLTAQILMNGAMQKLTDAMVVTESKVQIMVEGMKSLEVKMEETTGKLNALIETVDDIIRRPK